MILIGMFDSPFTRRVAISATLLGIGFEHRDWSVGKDFDRIREFNPLGRVPTLVLDDGETLIESAMILDWLDDQAGPERALLPASGPARRRAMTFMALATGAADKGIHLVIERVFRPEEKRHAPWTDRCRAQIEGAFAELDRAVRGHRRSRMAARRLDDAGRRHARLLRHVSARRDATGPVRVPGIARARRTLRGAAGVPPVLHSLRCAGSERGAIRMSRHPSLLIEIGTEELPVKALPELAQTFFDGVIAGLESAASRSSALKPKPLYTPRRLAVLLPQVATEQPEQRNEAFGPYLNVALDANGEPTPALKGFAQKNGLDVAQLERATDAKGERFVARSVKPGASTASLLPAILADAVKAIPIPKPMRWGDHDYAFARPAHWLVMLLGEAVVEGEVFGVQANRMSHGHRFHHPKSVWIGKPDDYVDALRAAQVLVDPDERRARIRDEVQAAAQQVDGFARVSDSLVEEVNCLVEWPRAILCGFDRGFLRVPHEALISTMESNQKFFPVLNEEHRLTDHFIGIANIDSSDPSEVRKGYERVIRPRFADAQFFFEEDLKQGIASMADGLASVTYQHKLGSYADKTARVATLAEAIANAVGVDPVHARRAAELSKADLQSRMVGEFPELQGIMGRYYASAVGETGDVADAIDQAYMPRFGGDAIASSKLGQVLAIAERVDTLAGGFAAGLKPTGNKDPFALRRNALGLARTIIETGLEAKDLERSSCLPRRCKPSLPSSRVAQRATEQRKSILRTRPLPRPIRRLKTRISSLPSWVITSLNRAIRFTLWIRLPSLGKSTISFSTACAATTPIRTSRHRISTPSPNCARLRCSTSTAA